ncbi:MAG: hypothetical protein ACXADW_23390 [Candidatus Hodarchaeales archaeon]|jgi:hypothetical protein
MFRHIRGNEGWWWYLGTKPIGKRNITLKTLFEGMWWCKQCGFCILLLRVFVYPFLSLYRMVR